MRSPLGTLVARVRPLSNKAPVPYIGRAGGGSWSAGILAPNNAVAQMGAMGSVGTLFAIVDRLATSSAAPEWRLWRKAQPGQQAKDREEVTSHLALDIWRKPNDFYTGSLFRETCQQHYDLVGEAWWVVARDPRFRSIPLELWPVRPDRMTPVPSRDDFLAGYIYTSPDGEQVPLRLDEVIQIRRPNPLDPYRGIGPVQTILADLEGVRLSAEWNRNFFRNSAEPGGIIKVDHRLSDPEFDELSARWGEQHRGVANAHRVAILEQGEYIERKYTQRDMQFVELRTVASSVIREAYGMPKFAIGDVEDVNRATADASKAWFAEQMTVPRLRRQREALNHSFLPLFGPTGVGLEFDFEDPVPANREADNAELAARAAAAKTLIDAGFDRDGVLGAVGLPEIVAATSTAQGATPRDVAEMVQKIYLGVGTVVTWEEARAVLVDAGADLDLSLPQPAPPGQGEAPTAPATTGEPYPPGRRTTARRRRTARLRLADQGDDEEAREDWEDRLDDLLDDWADVSAAQFQELADQIEAIVDDGSPADLAGLTVSSDEGAALLEAAMLEQATAAAERMAEMAAEQGVSISPGVPVEPPTNRWQPITAKKVKPALPKVIPGLAADLAAAAKVAVSNLGSRLAASAAGEALRTWAPGDTGRQVAGRVTEYLRGLTNASLRTGLGAGIWAAENEGRFATLEQAEADGAGAGYLLADEVRDKNTCKACKKIDGEQFDTLAEAEEAYPFGGYKHCAGGAACRGTFVAYWGTPPPKPPSKTTKSPLEKALESGERDVELITGGNSGAKVERVTFNDGTVAIRKTLARFDATSIDDQVKAELLAPLYGRAVGLPVPDVRRLGDDQVLMEFMPGTPADAVDGFEWSDFWDSDDGVRMGLADLLMENRDRHGGNFLVDGDSNVTGLIDHSVAFQWEGIDPTETIDLSRTSPGDIDRVRDRIEAQRPAFEDLDATDWLSNTMTRLDAITARGKRDVIP